MAPCWTPVSLKFSDNRESSSMYLTEVIIRKDRFPNTDQYPFKIPSIRSTDIIHFMGPITFFIGNNGSGKSALMDAISRKIGLLPWGGSKIHKVHSNPYETRLSSFIECKWNKRNKYGFHFRAEAFFNFAGSLDDILMDDPGRAEYFGGKSLNCLSHGESFLAFFNSYSCSIPGIYLMDEPEAALSPANQLTLVKLLLKEAEAGNRQYIIATHSPILLSAPGSRILDFNGGSIKPVDYFSSAPYNFFKNFLDDPSRFYGLNSEATDS